ncbi:MAG: glucosamine-6-phosphate deaminase, partial [Oscillospiraceae bacterium]|nr:glucosamine-6-phosphate deaminase [Oscillospiraceae bacterium]
MKVIVTKDYNEMCKKAARLIAAQITLKEDSVLGLATGSTPLGIYEDLVKKYEEDRLDFSEVCSVNLDEYVGLSGEQEQSYRWFMDHNLFDRINIPKKYTYIP